MAVDLTLWIGNDNLFRISGAQSGSNLLYLNSATASITLRDKISGDTITGASWPLSLSYISGSNGSYEATLPDTLVLTDWQRLTSEVSLDGGAGLLLSLKLPTVARERDGGT
jgi:hypothetical protein